jgi:glycosyltransferase involved in cell wall biosynthesis
VALSVEKTPGPAALKAPFTAIVVAYNEERRLRACLESLSFCDQLIVVDLGSDDSSPSIAREAGAEVLTHERVPAVEMVREYALSRARHDWVVFQDPDEVAPPALAEQAAGVVATHPEAALVRAPLQYYFRGRELRCCFWGQRGATKVFLVNRGRVRLRPLVHRGYEPAGGAVEYLIPRDGSNCIRHYWADSYAELVDKHRRYVREEGAARHASGERFSWRRMLGEACYYLMLNLFYYRGLLGGPTGVFLSFFHAWYVSMGWLSLRRYELGR